jgi:hypothetical protein
LCSSALRQGVTLSEDLDAERGAILMVACRPLMTAPKK